MSVYLRCQTLGSPNFFNNSALFTRTKTSALVAARALGKIGALAEGSLSIVTRDTVLRSRIRKMLYRRDRTYLLRLGQSTSAYVVTTIAVQTLARAVVGMTETYRV